MGMTGFLAAAVLLALAAVALTAVVLLRSARRDRDLALATAQAAQHDAARLEQRLGELSARLEGLAAERVTEPDGSAYLITDAGREPAPMLEDRLVLSAALGEPLVRAVALGHGVRRALGAESRHRIRYAVRQETRRARKQRRREMREVWLAHKRAAREADPGAAAAA